MGSRENDTIKWLEVVYHIKIDICETKSLGKKKYWGNIFYNKEDMDSTDYFDTYDEAVREAIHIAFNKIK